MNDQPQKEESQLRVVLWLLLIGALAYILRGILQYWRHY